MSTARWVVGSETSIGGSALDSLGNGNTSSIMNYDNTTDLYLYARIVVELGSITPVTGGNILLRYVGKRSGNSEDITDSNDLYITYLSPNTGSKRAIFQMVRIYPFSDGFVITNNSGVSLAATGNSVYITPYSEQVEV
jgi:hypothetical protein